MFKKLLDFSYERSLLEAMGFYISYFIIIIVSGFFLGSIIGILGLNCSGIIGNILAVIIVILIAFLILWKKNLLGHFGFLLLIIISGILATYGGALLGLILPAYFSTCEKQSQEESDIQSKYSYVQPIWHYILLSIVTFGLYNIFWFYRNWKHFKAYKSLDISPGWKTAGLIVPFYNFVLIYRQFKYIRDSATEIGIKKTYPPGILITLYIISIFLAKLPEPYWLLTLICFVPFAVVQGVLNLYWQKEQPSMRIKKNFSLLESLILGIGILCFSLVIFATFPQLEYISQNSEVAILKKQIVMSDIYLPRIELKDANYQTLKTLSLERRIYKPEILYNLYQNITVAIETYDKDMKPLALGTGFVISPNGHILTNHHVLSSAYYATVTMSDNKKFTSVDLVNLDFGKKTDLALIKINATNLISAIIGDSENITIGETILAIGNPAGLTGTVSDGIISQFRDLGGTKLIQITNPISPGSSGGPIINMYGEVIGITTSTLKPSEYQNLNFAIPINYIK